MVIITGQSRSATVRVIGDPVEAHISDSVSDMTDDEYLTLYLLMICLFRNFINNWSGQQ